MNPVNETALLEFGQTLRCSPLRDPGNLGQLCGSHGLLALGREPADDRQPSLAVPSKRIDTKLIRSLTVDEIHTVLQAPNPSTWSGVRDRAMVHLCFAARLRVSGLISLPRAGMWRRRRSCPRPSIASSRISTGAFCLARSVSRIYARHALPADSRAGRQRSSR